MRPFLAALHVYEPHRDWSPVAQISEQFQSLWSEAMTAAFIMTWIGHCLHLSLGHNNIKTIRPSQLFPVGYWIASSQFSHSTLLPTWSYPSERRQLVKEALHAYADPIPNHEPKREVTHTPKSCSSAGCLETRPSRSHNQCDAYIFIRSLRNNRQQ